MSPRYFKVFGFLSIAPMQPEMFGFFFTSGAVQKEENSSCAISAGLCVQKLLQWISCAGTKALSTAQPLQTAHKGHWESWERAAHLSPQSKGSQVNLKVADCLRDKKEAVRDGHEQVTVLVWECHLVTVGKVWERAVVTHRAELSQLLPEQGDAREGEPGPGSGGGRRRSAPCPVPVRGRSRPGQRP